MQGMSQEKGALHLLNMKKVVFEKALNVLKSHFDKLVLLSIGIWAFSVAFTFPRGYNFNRIWSDSEAYYAYLPAVFIYGSFENLPIRTPYQFPVLPETNRVNLKTTCGVAMLQLPFFAGAHFITLQGWFRTKDPTGFSMPYSDGLVISAIFYALFGLVQLGRVLLRYFSPLVVGGVLATVFWGTNLYFYVVGISGTAHVYSFFLNACVLFLTLKLIDRVTWVRMLTLAAALGLGVLVRPTNVFMALFPLGALIGSWKSVNEAKSWLQLHFPKVLPAAAVGLGVFIPQLMYWKHISGHWIYYSYGEEGFIHWKSPYLFSVLFSPTDGLFLYSPLAILGFLGLGLMAWKKKPYARLVLVIVALAWYAISSWWAWWFGGSFSHRAFIDWYHLLAFGIGYVLHAAGSWPGTLRVLTGVVLLAGMVFSVGLGYAYEASWSELTWGWDQYLHQVTLLVTSLFR